MSRLDRTGPDQLTPFDRFVHACDGAMLVVTAASLHGLDGCLVGFHSQVSIDPLRYAVCLSHANATYRAARATTELGVHLLGAGQLDLAALFGETTADEGIEKFDLCRWHRGPGRPPILDDVPVWWIGVVVDRVDLGDHTAYVLQPVEGDVRELRQPLRFSAVRSMNAGH